MKIFKQFFCFILFNFSIYAYAQTDKKIEVIGDSLASKDFIFLGEIHGMYELPAFKFDLIKLLVEQYGVTGVVMEMSKSFAYIINAYLQKGDTTIYSFLEDSGSRKKFQKWKGLYDDRKFTVYGMDFERMEFARVVQNILRQHEGGKTTELYKYVNNVPDSVIYDMDDGVETYSVRLKIYSKAQSIWKKEKNTLRGMLENDFSTIESIFENPASEKGMNTENGWKKRDSAMFVNISRLKTDKEKYLCIVGLGHLDPDWKKSLLCRYIKGYGADKIAVIGMVCKNCYTSAYSGSNVYTKMAADGINDPALSLDYDKFYKKETYSVINQRTFRNLKKYYKVSTYYVLFKDQPKN